VQYCAVERDSRVLEECAIRAEGGAQPAEADTAHSITAQNTTPCIGGRCKHDLLVTESRIASTILTLGNGDLVRAVNMHYTMIRNTDRQNKTCRWKQTETCMS
jgi:hypothetical protein